MWYVAPEKGASIQRGTRAQLVRNVIQDGSGHKENVCYDKGKWSIGTGCLEKWWMPLPGGSHGQAVWALSTWWSCGISMHCKGVGLDCFKCPFQLKQQYDSRISGPLDRQLNVFCAIGLPDPTQQPCIPIHQLHPSQGGTDFVFLHTSKWKCLHVIELPEAPFIFFFQS